MKKLPHFLHKPKVIFAGSGIVIACAVIATLLGLYCLPIAPQYTATNHKVDQPFTISLGQKTQHVDLDKIRITPAVAGSWKLLRPSIVKGDQLIFTPKSYFATNTTYRIVLPKVDRYVVSDSSISPVVFATEKAPSLTKSGVVVQSQNPVPADYAVKASLASSNRGLRTLKLRSNPAVEFIETISADRNYTWKPKNLLPQGSQIALEIYDEKNNISLAKKTINIASEPVVTSPLSRDRLGARDPIAITFDQPIEPASSNNITVSAKGAGAWKSPTEYVFTPEELAPGQTYSYAISPGLRSQSGGITVAEKTGTFSTMGAVAVSGSSPRGNELSQNEQTISFTFDQPVDRASAEAKFSISSGTIAAKSWSGNTLRVTVRNLGFQNTVTASIAPGVINTSFGLPSNQTFSTSFTTEVRSVRLSVPAYIQQHSATCSAASLRMVLSYRGIGSDEMSLVNAMGYAPRSMDKSTTPPTWDDPRQMFVGSVDGSIAAGTGAGPDAPPVAKAALAYGRSASPFTGINAAWIASQIHAGNPVLMFGSYSNTGYTSWKTASGSIETMNLTGHVTVVTGVKGEPSKPLGFWVNDPLRGAQYWTVGQVAANIARDPYRQAVVVY